MAYDNLCMYCFEELGGHSTCPHCGKDAQAAVPQIQMLPGSLVYHERFLVGRAVGQDATGIVYAAYDTKRQNKLRIREYLPRDCAERLNDGSVVPISGKEDEYDSGIRRLKAGVEAEEDPRKRHFFFEENGTAYIVQRKTQSATQHEEPVHRKSHEEPEEKRGGRGAIIALIAAIVVIAAAVTVYIVFGGRLGGDKDVSETPTADPNSVWVPADSPTVTPYTSPTFAALVDPDLSWMDYTFTDAPISTAGTDSAAGNTGSSNSSSAATKAPTATPRPTAAPTLSSNESRYDTVSSKSTKAEIRKLQQKLVTLGWLHYTNITGTYDDNTRNAVREFQRYINEAYNPATRLSVDGIAGPKTQQWLYDVNATRPTATPAATARATQRPVVTADPNDDTVIDESSSSSKIRAMQKELIVLGVLPEGADNGKYDTTTRSAVRRFQNRVNQLQGYEVVEASGRMDALSMAFLDYYVDEWRQIQTATPTPTVKSTATPTPKPTETATPKATKYESEKDPSTVGPSSSKEAIEDLQRALIDVGLLPSGTDDGVYGASTARAVTILQQWVNQRRGEQTLTVNGQADPLTRSYLRYCRENGLKPDPNVIQVPTDTPTAAPTDAPTAAPTATPTAEPTATPTAEPTATPTASPTPTVNPDDVVIERGSDRATIRQMQQLLADVGLLSPRGIDGVYGGGTVKAVQAFQQYVNDHGGELDVTGKIDGATRQTLEYYAERGMTVNDVEETPTPEPTAEPTAIPTEAPTEAPSVQRVNITIDGISFSGDTIMVGDESFSVQWAADGDVESYSVYVNDSAGNAIIAAEDIANTSFRVDAARMKSDERYTVRVGAKPVGGGELVWQEASFIQPLGATEVPATEVPATEAPTAIPTATPVPTPEPLPTVATISAPEIDIEGVAGAEGVIAIVDDSFRIRWGSEGEVQGYNVRITDGSGSVITSQAGISQTDLTVRAAQMKPGEVYTISVGAIPFNGSSADVVWTEQRFTLPVAATPTPVITDTPEPVETPTPAPTPAQVGRPTVTVGGAGYQVDGVQVMTDSTIIISWIAEGNVDSYIVYVENESGERQSLGSTTDTSRTIMTDNLPSGIYTVYVGAVPRFGSEAEAQWGTSRFGIAIAPTEAPVQTPTPEPYYEAPAEQDDYSDYSGDYSDNYDEYDTSDSYGSDDGSDSGYSDYSGSEGSVYADSDSGSIQALQMRLYQLGIMAGEPEQGVLDNVTLSAVAEFQMRVNEEYDAGLTVIDPNDPNAVIDAETMQWISRGF